MPPESNSEAGYLLKVAFAPEAAGDGDAYSDRILDAAFAQFAKYGIRRTGLDDIARAARVGRMTLYRRFPRREDVMSGLILREARNVIAKVREAAAACPDVSDRVVAGFLVVARDLAGHDLLRRLLISDPDILLPLLTVDAGPLLTVGRHFLAAQIVAARNETGHVSGHGDPNEIAEFVARFVLSLLLTPTTMLPVDNDDALRTFARRTIVPMIL